MQFSVVVTSRDRPEMLRRALASIRRQSLRSYEIVVVEDGSDPSFAPQYDAIGAGLAGVGVLHRLPRQGSGRGPSAVRNWAVRHSAGEFVAFLDDDDEWSDPDYLAAAAEALAATPGADLHFANQHAVLPDGTFARQPVWIEDVAERLPMESGRDWAVAPLAVLLESDGFCHLNTTIVRRSLLTERLGGFDETMFYEEDRDFYLRAVEAAGVIVYSPRFVARHHVPDPSLRNSASSRLSDQDRSVARIRVLEKVIERTEQRAIADYCRRMKGYVLKVLATRQAAVRDFESAYRYAREGLAVSFSYKWLGFVGWMWVRRTLNGSGLA